MDTWYTTQAQKWNKTKTSAPLSQFRVSAAVKLTQCLCLPDGRAIWSRCTSPKACVVHIPVKVPKVVEAGQIVSSQRKYQQPQRDCLKMPLINVKYFVEVNG